MEWFVPTLQELTCCQCCRLAVWPLSWGRSHYYSTLPREDYPRRYHPHRTQLWKDHAPPHSLVCQILYRILQWSLFLLRQARTSFLGVKLRSSSQCHLQSHPGPFLHQTCNQQQPCSAMIEADQFLLNCLHHLVSFFSWPAATSSPPHYYYSHHHLLDLS
uniref:Uncharacterized protein n=1 Tax=Cacopsylla melanoneura TaxID=428564 RepID=A0A8D9ARW6_9HEMI